MTPKFVYKNSQHQISFQFSEEILKLLTCELTEEQTK